MVKANILENTEKLLNGERIINPASGNMEVAKAIVDFNSNNDLRKTGILKDTIQKVIFQFYGMRDLAAQVIDHQPFYYDLGKNWWYWDFGLKCWKMTDETDILNSIGKLSTANTVKSKEKNEILEALKQRARINKPADIKPTWIQFKDYIFDIDTGVKHVPNPDYFSSNPIPWNLNKEGIESTPVIDKIFEEWVGKEKVQLLYEIMAYCLLPDYPIHRLFCLVGAGMNGKSCFLRMIEKFLGKENICSTELDTLLSSRFEVTRLHKKLVCLMGETNFSELSKTSLIKKLTGGDFIGFEYKNKNPFEDRNYAKILIATNNLPETTDKTLGFYRRWCIIDFPNQFSEQKNILDDIPPEEYESLALKSCIILKDLLTRRNFTNEGTIEERKEDYENKSNFLDKFLKEFTNEDLNGYITKSDFYKQFTTWCKSNRHRELSETSLGLDMKKRGIESSMKYFDWMNDGRGGNARIWLGRIWKT